MHQYVPRERKHKVLARKKKANKAQATNDTNPLELIPAQQADLEDKKRQMKEKLQNEGISFSGKKAKRLEKYIENKLKKDENRALIAQLSKSKTDVSLYQSSRKLGQGKETKKERLQRALKDREAGIDLDGDNEDVLFEPRAVVEVEHSPSGEDEGQLPLALALQPVEEFFEVRSPGIGLKRPLEVDDSGKPLLKKKKRRGGIKSKLSFKHEAQPELEWQGFSSDSEIHSSADSETGSEDGQKEGQDRLIKDGDNSSSEESMVEFENDSSSDSGSNTSDLVGTTDRSENEQELSSFKTWATQQMNEALGYQPTSIVHNNTEALKISGFVPRPLEQDTLPLELKQTSNTTRKSFSVSVTRNSEIQSFRLKLPVVAEEQKIMEAVHNYDTVVIYGATGSGKTTQVPQFLYEAGYGSQGPQTYGMIGITQPRRVAAVSMAKRVGDELGDHGKRVAYQIRFEGTVGANTAIKFMTDGVLLREVAQDIALRKYSAIIIDEAHERSINTDILIGMLSRVVKLRKDMAADDTSISPLKLIIMSATLRITDFTQNSTLFLTPPPVLQAEGRQYTVTTHFARKTHHDYVEEAFRKISKGHRKLPPGGFLVFLTGQNEISQLSKRLAEAFRMGATTAGPRVRISGNDAPIEAEDIDFGEILESQIDYYDDFDDQTDEDIDDDKDFEIGEEADSGPAKIHVLPLYSLLPTKEQLRVFEPPPDGSRLVVLATNIAETSLTIPGIRYVFDCGRSKERKFDRTTGVQSFEIGWISKASASQRAGRAGRTGPGHCYRLFSSAVYERDFPEFAEPEILRMPIEGVVLQLKAMNLQHVVNFPFPTPPNRENLAESERLLKYLSALSATGQITSIGATMSLFPLSPRFARILLVGHLHECLQYAIALVAGLSAANVFIPENQVVPVIAPRDMESHFTNADRLEEDARNAIRHRFNKVQKDFCFLDDKSDAIKLLQVVGEFAHEPTEAWCQTHFVRYKVLKEITQLRRQITDLMKINITAFATMNYQEKLPPPTAKQIKALKQMVAAGFIDHIAIRADLAPTPPSLGRKPTRAIDIPYLTLFPSNFKDDDHGGAVFIHPTSPLAHLSLQECPEYIVYSYLQRAAPSTSAAEKIPKTRMHSLTDITGGQIAALAKGTPLLSYGKPIKEVMPKVLGDGPATERECWVIPYLRAEATGGLGWPLPARKVVQRKIVGRGWVVE